MRRLVPLLALTLGVAACPTYDKYTYVSSQDGLIPADEFAKYGTEQAIAIAVGREFGKAYTGQTAADWAKQADAAVAYTKKFKEITKVVPDTLGHRLAVTFASGWNAQVSPIKDGKSGDETAGLPKH